LIQKPDGGLRRDQMLETFKASMLTMMLTVWSTIAFAQTPPAGAPGGGATSPSGTTTGATPGEAAAAGDGMDWIWIIVAVVVVAALLYYFLGRGRSTRV
jgi:hypothetical protein